MTPEGIEPSTFGFGIRRATNYAMESKRREGVRRGSDAMTQRPSKQNRQKGPIGIRTRIGGFRVLSDSHYTIGPKSEEFPTFRFPTLRSPSFGKPKVEYLGFDPSTSSLLRTHASNCANTPELGHWRCLGVMLFIGEESGMDK